MVADDLALTSTCPFAMQANLAIAEHDASRECYRYNTEKTKYIAINVPSEQLNLQLNGKLLGASNKEKHLGIVRNAQGNNKDNTKPTTSGQSTGF